jgi:Flp pilus assembly protein TadD
MQPMFRINSIPVWLMAVLLGLITVDLYSPALRHDFVNYDDTVYVTDNARVQTGLSWENLKWALITPVNANWHPLTVLTHMLDCQMYGLDPWGHHLTSILLHAINTMLVFLLLRGLTGAVWRSAVVAALFGWHPVHVESVAWVAERKDVLSALFGLLALLFYGRYAQSKTSNFADARASRRPATGNYLLALFFLSLGLMSKAMLITWPFVMLLLDWWPLGRFKPGRVWRLVLEKIPFFAVAAAVSIVTFVVQKQGGALEAGESLPLGARAGNALVSYCRYLGKLCWPADMAVFYPHPGHWPLTEVLLAGGLLAGITALFFWQRRRCPFLLMGWLWFVGTLAPVIQLIQTGSHAMADRYTYIPSLGVLILAVWGGYELTRGWRFQVMVLSLAGAAAILLCLALTRQQLGYWQDSETLFRHALAVTENNYVAHDNLGVALVRKGQFDEAIGQYQEALRLSPDWADAHYDLGIAFYNKGQVDEAIHQYQEALRLKPDYALAHNNLGNALDDKGQVDSAIGQYQEVIHLKPDYALARFNLGSAFYSKGRVDEAIRQFQEALRLKPDYAEACDNLSVAFARKGQIDEAISQFQEAIHLNPNDVEARDNLAFALEMKKAPAVR